MSNSAATSGTPQGNGNSENALIMRILGALISLAVVGVLGWTVKVTNANQLEIVGVKAQIQEQAATNALRFEAMTHELTRAVGEISKVADSMKTIADSMYSASEADEFIKKSEEEVKVLQNKTTDLDYRVKTLEKDGRRT